MNQVYHVRAKRTFTKVARQDMVRGIRFTEKCTGGSPLWSRAHGERCHYRTELLDGNDNSLKYKRS